MLVGLDYCLAFCSWEGRTCTTDWITPGLLTLLCDLIRGYTVSPPRVGYQRSLTGRFESTDYRPIWWPDPTLCTNRRTCVKLYKLPPFPSFCKLPNIRLNSLRCTYALVAHLRWPVIKSHLLNRGCFPGNYWKGPIKPRSSGVLKSEQIY